MKIIAIINKGAGIIETKMRKNPPENSKYEHTIGAIIMYITNVKMMFKNVSLLETPKRERLPLVLQERLSRNVLFSGPTTKNVTAGRSHIAG